MNFNKVESVLLAAVQSRFSASGDYPCLSKQIENFKISKPLSGLNVLHSTPLFFNSLPKLLPLLYSGARLTVVPPIGLPYDTAVVDILKECELDFRAELTGNEPFDIMLDCIGQRAAHPIRIGAVELTRSGEYAFRGKPYPCISVDRSSIKLLEDLVGTSDGLLRALDQRNISVDGKRVLLFGLGKVGRGIYQRLQGKCGDLQVVESNNYKNAVHEVQVHNFLETEKLHLLIQSADVIITCTGVKGLLSNIPKELILTPGKLLINMGAEDEYGELVPVSAVFNSKHPANFILSEPTRLKYLDATLALHNQSAVDLTNLRLGPGIHSPLEISESVLFDFIRGHESLWKEVCDLGIDQLFKSN